MGNKLPRLAFVFFSLMLIAIVTFQPDPTGSTNWPDGYSQLVGGESINLGVGVKTMMVFSGLNGLTMETENGYGPYLQTYVPSGYCQMINTLPLVFPNDLGELVTTEPSHQIEICNPWLGHPRYRILN